MALYEFKVEGKNMSCYMPTLTNYKLNRKETVHESKSILRKL